MRRHEALLLWREALTLSVRSDAPDLSARQMAALLIVYTTAEAQTVRGLAAALRIPKPAVTRALAELEKLGLARKKREERDKRSIIVQRTVKGAVFLSDFAERVIAAERATRITP